MPRGSSSSLPNEWERGQVRIKDLASGEESDVALEEL